MAYLRELYFPVSILRGRISTNQSQPTVWPDRYIDQAVTGHDERVSVDDAILLPSCYFHPIMVRDFVALPYPSIGASVYT